jgi:hypothetical protein
MISSPAEFAAAVRSRHLLKKNAIRALKAGFTTAAEIIRTLGEDSEN